MIFYINVEDFKSRMIDAGASDRELYIIMTALEHSKIGGSVNDVYQNLKFRESSNA